jgi:hypothetical protein
MKTAITMFDIAVLHPALKLTAVFENGPSLKHPINYLDN